MKSSSNTEEFDALQEFVLLPLNYLPEQILRARVVCLLGLKDEVSS